MSRKTTTGPTVFLCLAMLLLSGCTGAMGAGSALGAAGGAVSIVNQANADVATAVKTACAQYAQARAAANAVDATGTVPAGTVAKINSIESFGDAACAHPPRGDPLSTAIWLGTLVGEITALTTRHPPGA